MTYTNAQIRGAILRAADRIDRAPESYNFCRSSVPKNDCGTEACMWGWIGFELGMYGAVNAEVASACGITETPVGAACLTAHLYLFCKSVHCAVPTELRAYADEFFPADEKLDPAFTKFMQSFKAVTEAA